MGQEIDKDFTIEEDGTIVRGSTTSKINQMKKRLSSDNNREKSNLNNGNGMPRWLIILIVIGLIIGGIFLLNGNNDDTSSYNSLDSSAEENILNPKHNDTDRETEEEFQTRCISIKKGSTNNPPFREFYVDYPVEGRRALVSEIRWWIKHILDGYVENNYNQSLEDGEQMIKYYSDNAEEDIRFFEVNCRKEYETSKFVSFLYTIYVFSSGSAHGENRSGGATFRKSDGQIIDWDMFIDDADMQAIIKSGIYEYLGNSDYDKDYTSMPSCNPIFMRNGVKFLYQLYEIKGTSYADGEPSFTIPYSEIKYQMKSSLRDIIN